MSNAKRLHYSYDEYLRLLAESSFKLEYCDGVIYAMAGGTPSHAALAAAVIGILRQPLRGTCTVFSSDLKIRVDATDLATFPDVSVVCGAPVTSPKDDNAVTNPVLIVEVTSRSTEDYDRGDKLSHYKQLPSLRAVLFVSHRARSITVVERDGSAWSERELRGGEVVSLSYPSVTVSVDELYEGIALEL
ncbi:MAG: Uma2 family endonuclease [Polyangiales bacterium]